MRLYVYPTDPKWFDFLARRSDVDEVNFWQPGGSHAFSRLEPGELLLFRLKAPINRIAGGGVFVRASLMPMPLAWEVFGHKNGLPTFGDFRAALERYKSGDPNRLIGCIALADPVFLPRSEWIEVPGDYHPNLVQGKVFDATIGSGRVLLEWAQQALYGPLRRQVRERVDPATNELPGHMWTDAVLGRRRLGQGAFRLLVSESYARRCAVSGERTLPVLEAAHIRPVSDGGAHQLANGLLLRTDIHRLYDAGYVGVDPAYRIHVSPKLREEWQNGRIYYEHHGRELRLPARMGERPDPRLLEWHMDTKFLR
jgi:putative restriction endonuclease